MPTYILATPTGRITELGDFTNLDEIHKLRFFRDHPEFTKYIIVKSRAPKLSNRWRVIYPTYYVDLAAPYASRKEVAAMLYSATCNPDVLPPTWDKIRKVLKREFHDNDL
jgi:hypothetical protein